MYKWRNTCVLKTYIFHYLKILPKVSIVYVITFFFFFWICNCIWLGTTFSDFLPMHLFCISTLNLRIYFLFVKKKKKILLGIFFNGKTYITNLFVLTNSSKLPIRLTESVWCIMWTQEKSSLTLELMVNTTIHESKSSFLRNKGIVGIKINVFKVFF